MREEARLQALDLRRSRDRTPLFLALLLRTARASRILRRARALGRVVRALRDAPRGRGPTRAEPPIFECYSHLAA